MLSIEDAEIAGKIKKQLAEICQLLRTVDEEISNNAEEGWDDWVTV